MRIKNCKEGGWVVSSPHTFFSSPDLTLFLVYLESKLDRYCQSFITQESVTVSTYYSVLFAFTSSDYSTYYIFSHSLVLNTSRYEEEDEEDEQTICLQYQSTGLLLNCCTCGSSLTCKTHTREMTWQREMSQFGHMMSRSETRPLPANRIILSIKSYW